MKIIYLVRHAKSSWKDEGILDWQRPLLKEGIERASKISFLLKKKLIFPDLLISSHALRAINTAIIFAENIGFLTEKIVISKALYGKKASDVLELIKKQDNTIGSIMIFGHNPTFTELFNQLNEKKIENLSTSAVAGFSFNVENWNEIGAKKSKFLFLETGKNK